MTNIFTNRKEVWGKKFQEGPGDQLIEMEASICEENGLLHGEGREDRRKTSTEREGLCDRRFDWIMRGIANEMRERGNCRGSGSGSGSDLDGQCQNTQWNQHDKVNTVEITQHKTTEAKKATSVFTSTFSFTENVVAIRDESATR